MFNITINETGYIVYKEKEHNFVGKVNNGVINLPNYYDLTIVGNGYIKITNNKPIILPSDNIINYDKITGKYFIIFGEEIDEATYNILYEEYLLNCKNDECYQKKEKIFNDIKTLKKKYLPKLDI